MKVAQKADNKTATTIENPEIGTELANAYSSFPIVGIGASAGGLDAFTRLLTGLPEDTGMAFILVQHLDPDHPSHLTSLLKKSAKIPVCEAKNGMTVKPNQVFVIPPNANLEIEKGKLKISPRDGSHQIHTPVDFLFLSLAREQQSWAIGVVLSGTGSDGAAGMAAIKDAGGLTFAQDEKSAKFSGMPAHAGNVDFILPPEKIAEELGRIGHDPYLTFPAKSEGDLHQAKSIKDFRRILAILRSHINVDFSQYRDSTIRRRIQRRMVVNSQKTTGEYIVLLEKDHGEVRALFEDVLINVTSFFREPEVFETLKADIFPEIVKSSPRVIRVWVTACSTGQEAYSIAIALLEFLEQKTNPPSLQIFATDINEAVAIDKARRGFYPESIENEMSPERLRRYFSKEAGGYRINKAIRDLCIFAKQNIASDPPFSRMDLITCRNVLIYFTPDLQRHVISTFHYALNQTGFLVLGSSETVGANADMFEVRDRKCKIYSKKGMAVRPFSHYTAEDLKPGTLVMTRGKAPYAPGPMDFQKEADRILLGRYAPAAVLINSNLEVLQFRGRTGPYLEPSTGPATFNLLKMARGNLPLELGKIIQEARQKNAPVRSTTHLHDGEAVRKINLEVLPVKLNGPVEGCFLVLFEEIGKEPAEAEQARRLKMEMADAKRPEAEKDMELQQLRSDLAAAREYLQAVVEQHDASNEELKCANEEVLSSNEELQSTNEQLGTAKEELQSTNEELVTLNEELQTRNAELTQLNTDLKQAHEKLLSYVAAMADTVRGPFLVLRADLQIHKANGAFCKAFQVTAKETENRYIYELDDGQWNIPELRTSLREMLLGQAVLKDFEISLNFKKTGRRIFLLNARRLEQNPNVPLMILLSIEDITGFKQMEEVNQWLAAIVESSDDAIISKDLDGKIISCNQEAARLFGYGREEIIGQPVTILIPAELLNEEVKILDHIRRGERIEHFETTRRCKDGSLIDVSLTISPVKDALGKIIGASKIARDITERKRGEKKLAESLEREKIAREAAESANRAKDEFLAALSHELRTPLNPVLLVASDGAENPKLSPTVRKDFENIRKNIEMEARLIDDLLDLTRITAGKLSLNFRMMDAHAVLKDAITNCNNERVQKKIKLTVNLKASRRIVRADAVRLQQVFWNVIKNAVKFTPKAGKITIKSLTSTDGKKMILRVTDTGIGMTSQQLERIFSAFEQGDQSISRRFGGLGLGLAISRRLIDLHGGSISAESKGRNRGSTFVVELPLVPPGKGKVAKTKETPSGQPQPKIKRGGNRILLVEDHKPTRDALKNLLVRRKFQVFTASSLAEARALAKKKTFDLVISDIGLPDGSGNDLMTELHERYGLSGVALTGYGMEEDVARSLSAGFVAHLTKPVSVQILENILRKF